MLRSARLAILLSTSLLAGAALAQATPPASPAPMATGKFVTSQTNTEFKASKFVGLDVYGSENEKIGDIVEIVIDGSGNARAIVIGVGGFLGIGQKNVAVPWSAATWVNDLPPNRSTAATTATPPSGAATPSTGTASAPSPMGGGAARPEQAPARSPAEQAAYNGYPNHAKIALTKAELQEAPAYRWVADTPAPAAAK